jgi:hypothetical protein
MRKAASARQQVSAAVVRATGTVIMAPIKASRAVVCEAMTVS